MFSSICSTTWSVLDGSLTTRKKGVRPLPDDPTVRFAPDAMVQAPGSQPVPSSGYPPPTVAQAPPEPPEYVESFIWEFRP